MADAQTAAPNAVAQRDGAIVLARHGEPALSRKVMLTAEEYRKFWASYEVLGIVPGQTPPNELMDFVARCGALVSSTRKRSIESAMVLAGERKFVQHDLLVEAPLPPPAFPTWVRMSPKLWGFFARVWWWFFNHHEGQETRVEAVRRADEAADMLIQLAAKGEDVVVLAHGFFNYMIGRALKRRGWRLAQSQGYKYWSMRRFERG
ncbi:MAG TPA: histidine phosphatase family protein [Phenylobacterium sp.]